LLHQPLLVARGEPVKAGIVAQHAFLVLHRQSAMVVEKGAQVPRRGCARIRPDGLVVWRAIQRARIDRSNRAIALWPRLVLRLRSFVLALPLWLTWRGLCLGRSVVRSGCGMRRTSVLTPGCPRSRSAQNSGCRSYCRASHPPRILCPRLHFLTQSLSGPDLLP
jgi:hypothetical protein